MPYCDEFHDVLERLALIDELADRARADEDFRRDRAPRAARQRDDALRDYRAQHAPQLLANLKLLVRLEEVEDAVQRLDRVHRVQR